MRREVVRWISVLAATSVVMSACRRAEPGSAEADSEQEPDGPAASDKETPLRIMYPSAPGSFVDLAAEIRPSVVHIRSPRKVAGAAGHGEGHALGSGFIVDRDGHILTGDHLVTRAREIDVVVAGGDEYRAEIVGRDRRLGIALLKIEPRAELSPAPFGDSEALEVGEWVLAAGDPLGDGPGASAGIVAALGRGASLAEAGPDPRALIRIDAEIAGESAGGPLVNTAGEVVGVVLPRDRSRRGAYAVPIARAISILPMLKEHGYIARAWLGVFVHPVSEERAQRRGMEAPAGALVSEVVAGGPADEAGIRPGDIILRFDGEEVDHRSLPHVAATSGVDKAVTVAVRRGTDDVSLTLVTESMPE